MKILLSSHNQNKIRELRILFREEAPELGEVTVLSPEDAGLYEEVSETGTTFYENAYLKARYGAENGYITVADDSGLAVDALGGAPGVYSARYAGEGQNDAENNALLLKNMENVPDGERTARYVSSIVCIFPDGRVISAEECCEGIILREPRGTGGFGYDPLFYFPPLDKTFASITLEEKNKIRHRGKAFRRFIRTFSEIWEKYYAEQ